jgi:hypothetical protein
MFLSWSKELVCGKVVVCRVVAIPCWSCSEVTGELGTIGGMASTEQRVGGG